MGVTSKKAHAGIALLVTSNRSTLESASSQRRYARKLRLNPDEFHSMRSHPAVRWKNDMADWLEFAQTDEGLRLSREVRYEARKTIEGHFSPNCSSTAGT